MSYRTLLVHLDDGPGCPGRLQVAVRMAATLRACLIGLYLGFGNTAPSAILAMLPEGERALRQRRIDMACELAERSFRDAVAAEAIDTWEWRAPDGDALDLALMHGRCADLTIAGQHNREEASDLLPPDFLPDLLLGIGRPVLVVPYIGARPTLGQRVLIASNGRRESARAIGDAMPLLETASKVDVLLAARAGEENGPDFRGAARALSGWLGDHGIEPAIEAFTAGPAEAGAYLLSRAADFGSDLVVMGAYGHLRLRERVLGGMTRSMLESMTVPVLMSH